MKIIFLLMALLQPLQAAPHSDFRPIPKIQFGEFGLSEPLRIEKMGDFADLVRFSHKEDHFVIGSHLFPANYYELVPVVKEISNNLRSSPTGALSVRIDVVCSVINVTMPQDSPDPYRPISPVKLAGGLSALAKVQIRELRKHLLGASVSKVIEAFDNATIDGWRKK